ncbi:hypothetical protein AQI88_17465 [Streptomyces cellostaticus]|uniref:Uncharacterized protein n=1 Tax=Streptomyces cellostaticus TaxID=67285 RepID=A0A101NLC0_9ACTN|nr:DUF6215 domain-containing protein [Streptomyces cellostaticus]KUM95410.1 hypothetical protein AQI88_17465 [Streptomyces cellostaticus]GHI01962.1 hypothetical protein Scel_02830 [Streptomyces cellostaticus]
MVDAASKEGRPGVQAVAAVVAFAGLLGVLWAQEQWQGSSDRGPATCSNDDHQPAGKHVSAARLCTALNRSDLPALLGTPREQAETAYGSESSVKDADGTETPSPQAEVSMKTYSVKLWASDDELRVAEMSGLLGRSAEPRTVLGHPAVLYSDHTIALKFSLGGGKVDTGTGGIARHLLVARDAKDGGGSFEVALWRQDDVPPDDTALLRVAERVLPTVPGWA